MLDPTVERSHPKFEALFRDLCVNKLNADGSSRPSDDIRLDRDLQRKVCRLMVSNWRCQGVATRRALEKSQYLCTNLECLLQELREACIEATKRELLLQYRIRSQRFPGRCGFAVGGILLAVGPRRWPDHFRPLADDIERPRVF